MDKNKFTLTWISSREIFDSKSRSSLLINLCKKKKKKSNKIIDLGSGSGSFLRWCYASEIFF